MAGRQSSKAMLPLFRCIVSGPLRARTLQEGCRRQHTRRQECVLPFLSHHPKMPENTYYFEAITAARSMLVSEEDGLNRNATLSLDDYRRFIARRSWYFEKPWNPGDGAISACEGATLRRTIVTVTFSLSPGLAPWCPVR